ncbi:hypothetical protein AGABI2DRAFT_208304 [Agaricus bisporus var. bisporus H97]|uniref:hypothetical protein n=1 Tax=Agaricus bisporus var. bisporus (strain H97 / ATCC MYA-4626 / FGSC 10389) TaxID=936046 RepID=UPI00029F54AA|nr:hypothetical protein AGABI2DRAFT_208304 [Agaricus bisporus var. bisporus H97]EKV45338.1 hypothetical protein AGABI2DRAFT_208304 [Agaricus bisporus var. bisporus H97]
MSRSLSVLRSSLSPLVASSSRCPQGTRGYAQAVLRKKSIFDNPHHTPSNHSSSSRKDSPWGNREKFGQDAQPTPLWQLKPDPQFSEHLNAVFNPLEFNPEAARRCLTHASHPTAVNGHNQGMSFLGRRVLETYLHLYLSSSKHLKPTHDFNQITNWTIGTYTLGQHVGSKWGLGRVMRWVPTLSKDRLRSVEGKGEISQLSRVVGLYKVQGDAVAAVMGTIFQQFGGSVALRAFHTRVLPNLLLDGKNGGLPLVFHSEAREICNKMGGSESDLTKPIQERA